MLRTLVRRGGLGLATLAALLTLASTAGATVTGGCTATGTSTSGGSIDLTNATEWHLKRSDVAGGNGSAPSPQKSASVSVYALGLALPIASGTDEEGEVAGSVSGVAVEPFALIARKWVVAGSSDSCSGQVTVYIDDVDPVATAAGGGGIAAAVVGFLVLLLLAGGVLGAGILQAFGGLIFGALAGVGLALALEQFGVTDPTSLLGLAIVIGCALVGLVVGLGPWRHGKEPAATT
jgi:hypothetical protein